MIPEESPQESGGAYNITDYDYELPEDRIAQHPTDRREDARLLVLDRLTGTTAHRRFAELDQLLGPSDVLVVNDTRVMPARLMGRKATGGKIEVLLIDYAGGRQTGEAPYTFECRCLIRASRAPKPGTELLFGPELTGRVVSADQDTFTVAFQSRQPFDRVLEQIGRVPLPPYIKRNDQNPQPEDRQNYQTVYAAQNGAVAAPTAGLHFSENLLSRIREKGADIVAVTLHVSYGTFMPVRVSDIREHGMHIERYQISEDAAERINSARREGRRIVAVGTTAVRTLEYAADASGRIAPQQGECDLFIYPGYRFKAVDAMITNFHLPKSTLLILVSAFAGRQRILSAYREAVEKGYRFFSYGDAMLIV
ncbi:MAG: tRNA preQ1(34) S-adenosylmethionine ribosyltransferase-isomerase QueA [Desulfobacterales bacterium]|nr:tRNA preQ1(34) S-adenosylmethionine ribosyltransferase-isomerase QueA [Desulfobacterales bacterium]